MEATWHAKETLAIILGRLLDAGDGVVVTLRDTGLVMHRTVLVARNPVSAAVLQVASCSDQVTVSAVEDPVLRQLLAFLCGLQVRPPQLPSMASRLLPALADKCGVPALEDRCEEQVPVGMAAALTVGHSCTGLGQAAVAYVEPLSVEVTVTRGRVGAANTLAENVGEISGLLPGTGTLSPAVSGSSPDASTQPRRARRRPCRRRRQTPATLEPSSDQVTVSAVEDPVLRQLLAFLCGLQVRPPQLPGMASRLLPALADKCGVPALEDRCEEQVPVGTAAALAVGHSCTGLGQATVAYAYAEPLSVEVTATRGRSGAVNTLAKNVDEISGLLPGTGTLSPAVSGSSPDASTQPRRARRRPYRRRRQTPATLEPSSDQVTVSAVEDPVLRQLLAFLCGLQVRPPQLPGMASPLLLALADNCGVPAFEDRCEKQVPVGTAAALAVGHSRTGLGQPAVACVEPLSVEVTATRGWAGTANTLAENVGEINGPLPGTGTLSPAVSGSSPDGSTQPRGRPCRWTPATAAPTTAASHQVTPSPDGTAVSCLRSLSAVEKGRRLIEAAKEGALEELEALLVAGANTGFRDADLFRRSALHWAAAEGHEEVARQLVWHGASVDTRSGTLWTPLHLAAQGGHAAMVRLLLAAPADHSARDCQGWTPLHVAAFGGHEEVVTALMEAGADRGNTDLWGNTPRDVAMQRGHWQLVDVLAVPPSLHQNSL